MTSIKPIIFKKDGKKRCGKGFSREELKKARLSLREALKLSIPIDSRRKTIHEENVNTIKKFSEKQESVQAQEKKKI